MKRILSEKINKICEKYNVISFDIFDTLLKRDVMYPRDVFCLVEKLYKVRTHISHFEFVEKRIEAEKIAKEKSGFEDITLEEIYLEMDLDEIVKGTLKELELEVEKNLLVTNAELKKVFDFCKKANKRIYIISDMYLPKVFIEEALVDNGYSGYVKLFLSNEYRATKKSGNLYKVFLEEENLDANDVLHIGDSRYSDVFSPGKIGIKGYHIKRKRYNTIYLGKKSKKDILEQTALFSFINNHMGLIENRNVRIGYEVLGPILCSYCSWLHRIAKDSNAKIWFAARDMFWFEKAYGILYRENCHNYEYVYVSRKSLRALYASVEENILKSGDIFPRDKYSISQITRYMGYEIEDINNSQDVDIFEKKYLARDLIEYKELKNIWNSKKILELEKIRSIMAENYLKQEGFLRENIILADVGWHGTTQFILQEIQKKLGGTGRLFGCYIGDLQGTYGRVGKENAHVLYFDENVDKMFSKGTMLFESLLAATHGTTIDYREESGKIEPVLAEFNQVEETIIKIQNGALRFVEEYKKSLLSDLIDISPEFSRVAFERLVGGPCKEELEALGGIVYDDNGHHKLAMPKPLTKYIFHPKDVLLDVKYAPWRIGFMYRLFKIRLPYGKIYKVLRKVSGKHA